MKKFALSVLLLMLLVLFGAQASFAESVVEKDGLIFIADGGLVVKTLDGADACLPESDVDLSTASDVIVLESDGIYTAIVTIHPSDPINPESTITDIAVVDVTACYLAEVVEPGDEVAVDDCYAYLEGDTLYIPCVLYEGDIISAKLEQNGNSQNWKASGAFKNITVSNHHHGHHNDDDN